MAPRRRGTTARAEIPLSAGTGDSAAADGPEAADFPPGALPNQRSATRHARSRGRYRPPVRASFGLFHLLLVKARERSKMPPPPTVTGTPDAVRSG